MERFYFTRYQEILCVKDYYETQIRILQDTHKKEKRTLKMENLKFKNDIRVQKIINTKLRKKNGTMMEVEAELQQVKFTLKKLQEDKDMEVIEIRHRREKRILTEQMREVRDCVRSLKRKNNNLKKDCEERMTIQKKLEEEVQTLSIMNNKLQKQYETVMGTEMKLRMELERVKVANSNMNKYWEAKMKDCEEEKKVLVIRNQELQKELESIKKRGVDTTDDGKVSLDNFTFIRRLGEGAFGTVVLAEGKLPGAPKQLYAIKTLKKRRITSSTMCQNMAEKEALLLTSGHPFTTTLYSCIQNKDDIFFVMEYMSGGNLKEQLDEVEVFSEKRTKFYAAEITLAVQFLHQQGILHRDLKLENVLVGSDGHCKIADFGLSKVGLFRHCRTSTQCGTPFCMAPEIVKNLPYGQGVDWWAVGIMMFEMMTGQPPFDCDEGEEMDDELDQKIMNDEVDFPEDMSLAAISIVMQLLMKNPTERLGSSGSVDTVRQHPFFKGIDWQAVQEKRVKPPEKEMVAKIPEEDNHGFSKVLKDDNAPFINNQDLFLGFSFINYGVKPG
jgi:serine/threonine protein kinase